MSARTRASLGRPLCRSTCASEDDRGGFLTDFAGVTGLRRQLSLLGTAPGFRLLFLSTLGSSLGTLLATVALVVDIKDRTNSGSWVSVLLIVEFLPAVAVGLALGSLLDRISRRGLMIEGVATLRGEGIRYRAVLLPLSENGARIDHVLGAMNYRLLRTNEALSTQVNFRRLPVPRNARV